MTETPRNKASFKETHPLGARYPARKSITLKVEPVIAGQTFSTDWTLVFIC